jgi:uncharacterized protein YdeI (YjbR/CyaY-like superfamily)
VPDEASQPAARFFKTAAAFRGWLRQHAGTAPELIVGYHKKDSGRPSITWEESVDEALCVGWIDGVRKRIDDSAYQIRFTPRKPGSIWSRVNIERVRALQAQGRMQPAGLAAFERRSEARSRTYAYEQAGTAMLEAAETALFREHSTAWRYFCAQAPSYRKRVLWWIVCARQPATRARRVARLIEASGAGRRL